jgi:sulfoxide reductase catalytic subunit YedY
VCGQIFDPSWESLGAGAATRETLMLIRRADNIPSSEITDEGTYLRRREFLRIAGGLALGTTVAPLVAAWGDAPTAEELGAGGETAMGQSPLANVKPKVVSTDEKLNTFEQITSYNNFYEFGTGKNDPQRYSGSLKTSPWTVKIDGLCNKPASYQLEDLIKPYQLEERIYRMRCVEAWSMVIPWVGIPLGEVLKRAEPQGKATFVEFTTVLRPSQMPGQNGDALAWPYVEGLRMDEAMHPLSILAVQTDGKYRERVHRFIHPEAFDVRPREGVPGLTRHL